LIQWTAKILYELQLNLNGESYFSVNMGKYATIRFTCFLQIHKDI
jgi:hypothetical protein